MRHIPNLITTLNLLSGFMAVIWVFRGEPVIACWFIAASMVFDFFDGFASRLLDAYSDMGKELDSLADLVSFGVAPGLIIYTLLDNSGIFLRLNPESFIHKTVPLLVSAAIPVTAGLRLARFNVDTEQKTSFRGLPTPAAALAVISVVIAYHYTGSQLLDSFTRSATGLTIFTLIISGLMVSRVPLLAMKFSNYSMKGNEGRYLLIAVCLLIVLILGFAGIPWLIPAYIVVSLISMLF